MQIQYRYRQLKNLFFKVRHPLQSLKWVFIYGMPRSGSTYMLTQYLKVAKRGTGDWRLHEFAHAFKKAEQRQRVTLDIDKLIHCFRNNMIENAPLGGGEYYDFIVKEASSNKMKLKFLSRVFNAPPAEKIFLYREPEGWWSSAKEKFQISEAEAVQRYKARLDSFEEIGGTPLEYGTELQSFLENSAIFKDANVDNFKSKREDYSQPPEKLYELYDAFKTSINHSTT
jgi:hypothetical protein